MVLISQQYEEEDRTAAMTVRKILSGIAPVEIEKELNSENRQVEYEMEQMEMVEHANAITIHKAQGSECQVAIIPWVRAFYNMLKRNILYTAVTRAKTRVYLVGERNAISQAIHTDDSGTRRTMLGERILYYYRQYQRQAVQENEQLRLAV